VPASVTISSAAPAPAADAHAAGSIKGASGSLHHASFSQHAHDAVMAQTAAARVARLQNVPVFVLDNSVRETTVGQMRGHTLPDKRESHGGQPLEGGGGGYRLVADMAVLRMGVPSRWW
jgi:hypothetical protein